MRILFTFTGGSGHFHPLVPIARAAACAGHTVAFAAQPGMLSTAESAGFTAFDMGGDTLGERKRHPLLAYDAEREDQALRETFAGRVARERAAKLLALCTEWQPDIIVRDEIDFGSAVAAERLGLPHANVLVIAAGSFVRTALLGDRLNELRAAHGLTSDPDLEMLRRYLVLSPFPPSLRDPAFPLPATAHSLRPLIPEPSPNDVAPPWLADLDDAPTVYFTLGTIFNMESGDLFPRVLAGLRDLPVRCNVAVTVGRHIDPAELGPQPAHVHIERFIPQALLLPHCQAVVSHGGSGSTMGALGHGLPSVLIPIGADQPLNAARCAALGAARVLDPVTATPASVRDAVSTILTDTSYRQAAERLRDEIATLPGPDHAVHLLERLMAEQRPIVSA